MLNINNSMPNFKEMKKINWKIVLENYSAYALWLGIQALFWIIFFASLNYWLPIRVFLLK